MKAVIMAGGKGTRLRPLTCDRPKPMVPILNKPMMEHIVRLLRVHGFTEIIVTAHYFPEAIVEYFGDGSEFGVSMTYSIEEEPLGTAGSVRLVKNQFDGPFLVISGDALTDFDLAQAAEFHLQRKPLVTIVLTRVSNPLEYGLVITDRKSGRIERFLEKPGWSEVFSDTVNTGIYVVDPEALDFVPAEGPFDFSRDLFPILLTEDRGLLGFLAEGYWSDIGTLEQYWQAHQDVLAGRVKIDVPGSRKGKDIWVGTGAYIDPNSVIQGPAVIGDYSRISAGARVMSMSVIGENCTIGPGSSIKRSILWGNTFVDKNAELRGAVVCGHTKIGSRAAVYEGAVIGSGCSIGKGSVVKPGVRIWPGKTIDTGATVTRSVIWNEKWSRKLFGTSGIRGTANAEITPEFAAALGSAYGSTLAPGSKVIVGTDGAGISEIIGSAFASGLLGTGVDVWNAGSKPRVFVHHAVKADSVCGGVYLSSEGFDLSTILIQFIDSSGRLISKINQRSIENAFFREDFRRQPPDGVGKVVDCSGRDFGYTKAFLSYVDLPVLQTRPVVAVVSGIESRTVDFAADVFRRINCVVAESVLQMEDSSGTTGYLKNLVTRERADLGVLLNRNGDVLAVVDDTGRLLSEDVVLMLSTLALLKRGDQEKIKVPVTAPAVLDLLARFYNGKLERTPGTSALFLQTESILSLARVIELIARDGQKLSEVVDSLMTHATRKSEVFCPWELRGTVMRGLIEQEQGKSVELVDGIRVNHEDAWTLVLPDSDEPVMRIFVEAPDSEKADRLVVSYTERISGLQQGFEQDTSTRY